MVSAAMISTLPATPPAFRSAQRAALDVVVFTSVKPMLDSTESLSMVIGLLVVPIQTCMSLSLTT